MINQWDCQESNFIMNYIQQRICIFLLVMARTYLITDQTFKRIHIPINLDKKPLDITKDCLRFLDFIINLYLYCKYHRKEDRLLLLHPNHPCRWSGTTYGCDCSSTTPSIVLVHPCSSPVNYRDNHHSG